MVGAFATHGVIYDFLNKLRQSPGELEVLGNGKQCKPYLLVDELVDAMLFISAKRAANASIATTSGHRTSGVTVSAIAGEVVRVAAPGASIRYTGGDKGWIGDVPQFNYSIGKLQKLGWQPAVFIRTGHQDRGPGVVE